MKNYIQNNAAVELCMKIRILGNGTMCIQSLHYILKLDC